METEDHHFIQRLDQECTCPISKCKMLDPVITADGQTYEREAITNWFNKNETKSPITNLPLKNTDLIPNISFKNITQLLYSELPAYFAKEQALLTEISQLKEEIAYLKDQLQHEKQQNEEMVQKQEREFKTKRIEKQRHEHKNDQLKIIREQKNTYQRQLQDLRSKEQQQARQIQTLKSELANFTDLFEKAAAGERKYTQLYKKVHRNRKMVLFKLEFSFISNLTFIGHLLQSIEDAKKFETQSQQEKGTQQTIESINDLNKEKGSAVQRKSVIEKIEELIRQKVNGKDSVFDEKPQDEQLPVVIRPRIIRRRYFPGIPGVPLRFRIQVPIRNAADGQNVANNSLPQQLNDQVGERMILENNQPEAQQNSMQKILEKQMDHDTELYKQLLSIKWMMSKRNYREIPEFYNYKVCKNNEDSQTFWYGVKLSVLESHIPFAEFLPYSWNHVRWLDLSSSNIDDELWRKFIDSSHNFRSLMFINAYRNKIENIKKSDLQKFPCLVKFVVLRNKLTKESIDELNNFSKENPRVKVEFSNQNELMEEEYQEADEIGYMDLMND